VYGSGLLVKNDRWDEGGACPYRSAKLVHSGASRDLHVIFCHVVLSFFFEEMLSFCDRSRICDMRTVVCLDRISCVVWTANLFLSSL
jgi:hypothetical protein